MQHTLPHWMQVKCISSVSIYVKSVFLNVSIVGIALFLSFINFF